MIAVVQCSHLQLASLKYNIQRPDITQAQLCMLQELMIGKIEGCNVYSAEDTEDFQVSGERNAALPSFSGGQPMPASAP